MRDDHVGIRGARVFQGHHVPRPFVGRPVDVEGDGQESTNLRHRVVATRLEPGPEPVEQDADVVGAVPQERGRRHHDVGAGQEILDDVVGLVHTRQPFGQCTLTRTLNVPYWSYTWVMAIGRSVCVGPYPKFQSAVAPPVVSFMEK